MKSLNWETKNLTATRDYAVVTDHRHEVDEIVECFEADWHRKAFDPGEKARLIWCPDQRAGPHRPVHRRRQAHAVRPERAVPGRRDHRAPGACGPPRREGSRPRASAAHAQEGQARRGRRGAADPGRRRDQDPQAQGAEAARQDAARRRRRVPSSGRSISPRAASTAAASSRSRSGTRTSSSDSTRRRSRTGRIPTRWTSPTRA